MKTDLARTDAQTEASRENGAQSSGPVTALGKLASSLSAITHGLATRAALLPSEPLALYESHLAGWFATIPARTPGVAHAVARIADTSFRADRLARLEAKIVNASLEAKVAESAPAKALKAAKNTLAALQGLAGMAEVVNQPTHVAHVATILPAVRQVVAAVEVVGVPAAISASLGRAVAELDSVEYTVEVPASVFHGLATPGREAEAVLVERLAELEKDIEAERERLADETLLGDDEQMKMLDRHRARLNREMQAHLVTLKLLREVAVPDEVGVGASGNPPFLVELKVLGRARVDLGPLALGFVRSPDSTHSSHMPTPSGTRDSRRERGSE
jgi:hypothetical protein